MNWKIQRRAPLWNPIFELFCNSRAQGLWLWKLASSDRKSNYLILCRRRNHFSSCWSQPAGEAEIQSLMLVLENLNLHLQVAVANSHYWMRMCAYIMVFQSFSILSHFFISTRMTVQMLSLFPLYPAQLATRKHWEATGPDNHSARSQRRYNQHL